MADATSSYRQESSVEISRREREERRSRLKRVAAEEQESPAKRARIEEPVPIPIPPAALQTLPKDWIECPPLGKLIAGAIIPSKVPLGEAFNQVIQPGKRYGLKRVPAQVRLVIDLTNSNRYYSPSELQHIKHIKIACKGRNEVPGPASVNRFVYEMHRFLRREENRGSQVLVHCTHGFNRTGFMIVNYLIRFHGYSLFKAINEFAEARPPGIYKPSYLRSLYKLYGGDSQACVSPQLPAWKSKDELEEENNDDETEEETTKPVAHDDVLGDPIPFEQQAELRQMCLSLLDQPMSHGNNASFPGSHPVSLDRKKLLLLRQKYYLVGCKADGTRYMMLLLFHGCYLIDRKFNFRRVEMRFPRKELQGIHNGTLVDGEMVIDVSLRRYLIYDLMALNSAKLHKKTFLERWGLIMPEIILPRQQQDLSKLNEPFRVRRKDFWLLSAAEKMPRGMSQTGIHGWDGLIFQGVDDPYVCRTHQGLLKWKFAHMNSVDFLLKKRSGDESYALALVDNGKHRVLEGASVIFPAYLDPSSLEEKVIECSWNPKIRSWEFMRLRPDKEHGNAYNTYRKVWNSIEDNITQAELFEEMRKIVELPLYKERSPAVIQELIRSSPRLQSK